MRSTYKRLLASIHDTVMAMVAMLIAVIARYGGIDALPDDEGVLLWVLSFGVIATIVFQAFGLGRGMWRFASVTDLRTIVVGSTVAILVFLLLLFFVTRLDAFPRTVPLIAWFVMIVLLGAPRLVYRALKDGGLAGLRPRDLADATTQRLLIIGTVSEADKVIRTYALENARGYKVEGIIDYKATKRGRKVRGVPILGDLDELVAIVARLSRAGTTIDAAVLAGSPQDTGRAQKLASSAAQLGLPLRRVSLSGLGGNSPNLENITLDDLLGRPPAKLDLETIRGLVADRVIVVTGAGGSIGSEIVRRLATFAPTRLVLVDSSEYALYRIDQELSRTAPSLIRRPVIADVRDLERLRALMKQERPSVVFHAAALKHVPLVEANPCEGVMTNVVGSRNVADAAIEADVDALVMISTDKAIRPTSVMGATKRVAEAYCQALDVSGVRTRFITVRFGNVLGSTGSVVPLFKRQIKEGGPITVTHPDMKRYFMTIKEAAELVLQAAAVGIGKPEQRGRIMVLDMGEPVRIVDLAHTMIALAGLRVGEDIEVVFQGLRPGEKLFEELFDPAEPTIASGADGVMVAAARITDLAEIRAVLDELERRARADDADGVRAGLATITPELPHGESGTAGATAARVRDRRGGLDESVAPAAQ
ncbi:polysaccharide biosynthesis protein [Salinarimonas sp. NSM]|uniref:polysaccharide biosynthesis protein n=1 Tax=Salinarimonas sp. NSM TaxID=3458003 RepID=UPI00403708E2